MKTYRIMLALLAGFAFAGNTWADDIAKVNGIGIPQSRFDTILQSLTAHGQQQDTPDLRAQIKDNLITTEVISQEAVKEGLDKTPDFLAKLDLERQKALNAAFIDNYIKTHPISDADAQKAYDEIKKANVNKLQYHIHHILVKDEATAKNIIAELKKGAKFDTLAKKDSIDPSGKEGGDLGWLTLDNVVPEFADAVSKLKKGEVSSTPVKSQFGYHVIRLDDTKPVEVPSFEDLKPRIEAMLQEKNLQTYVKSLRDQAKIQ